ncbi:conserved hypothetical protein [Kineococcus radiotolerans SRS30216 = ATCC BAA-149]|uniref:DUF4865 domain-containing protein n=2 Tax=Kineococcus radiotolerans TaxID=131568 RepID=A6WBI2_KINRD|nr:conserved hypothetical protein [Kineococcus radiotolerans SRS30216 = ATCC BAA-149]
MLVMQYEITLPADYDMRVVRDRVARTGHLLDRYPGLGVKAFLVRERGIDGSSVNQYAPFYLWADAAGAASFLWSGTGFSAVMRDFGRPVVQTWVGGTAHQAARWPAVPSHAVRHRSPLPTDADLAGIARETDTRLAGAVEAGEALLAAYGIDPRTWELVTFTLHRQRPALVPEGAEVFQVLHVSTPEREQLPTHVARRLEPAP